MAIQTSGSISLNDIQNEFGGTNPINLNEYYRGGGRVSNAPQNQNIPTSGSIKLNDFYGSANVILVAYQMIGGGGGGGSGLHDNDPSSGFGDNGTATTITGVGVSLTAAGGAGGQNAAISYNTMTGRAGQDSIYGPGGAGGTNNTAGSPAPATSYGAGGGGGGGDNPSTFDSSGRAGRGGSAGTYLSGSFTVPNGSSVSVTVGIAGLGSTKYRYDGAAGANGFVRLFYEGNVRNITANQTVVISI